jgi:hypothetical protein
LIHKTQRFPAKITYSFTAAKLAVFPKQNSPRVFPQQNSRLSRRKTYDSPAEKFTVFPQQKSRFSHTKTHDIPAEKFTVFPQQNIVCN